MHSDRLFLYMNSITIALALIVIVLGAYARLSDAGLGCPDWPGCYGRLVVPADESTIEHANQLYPERPLEQGKAWKEMLHRYAAGCLGLLILLMSVLAWKNRGQPGQPFWLPMILLGLVIFQALLGMWTVTLLLKPIIVIGHLLGGMTILLLLVWQLLSHLYWKQPEADKALHGRMYPWALLALIIAYMQISLGGWTSANYAALACPDLPLCQGAWWPQMDFKEGFIPWRGLGVDYEYGVLNTDARTAIHVSHRIGALLTLFAVGIIALSSMKDRDQRIRNAAIAAATILVVQFGLGVANVLFVVPISVAVAHNGVAALLLASLGALLFFNKNPQALKERK
jgi:heme a synthase